MLRCQRKIVPGVTNASSGLGFLRDPERHSTYQVIMGEVPAQQATLPTELDNLRMIPAHKNLLGANIELVPLEALASTGCATPCNWCATSSNSS